MIVYYFTCNCYIIKFRLGDKYTSIVCVSMSHVSKIMWHTNKHQWHINKIQRHLKERLYKIRHFVYTKILSGLFWDWH